MASSLLARLDARDRALFSRLLLPPQLPARGRTPLVVLTHLGGATATITLALLPWADGFRWFELGRRTALALLLSHLVVQYFKRCVGRPRPSRFVSAAALVAEPDRFSFPSGHAAAAMSLAVAYAVSIPILTVPLVVLAALIGATRVCLGVHYPGDVAAGQLIAIATVGALRLAGL